MTYICVKCRHVWTEGVPTDHYSGGLCDPCITEYVRHRQKRAGFEECFRTNVEVCSRGECDYWHPCNKRYLSGEPTYEAYLSDLEESKFG